MSQVNAIATALDTLEVGAPVEAAGLTMLPLLAVEAKPASYLTLDEALAHGTVRISEVSEGGRVPELLFLNDEPLPVLVLDGEELIGAKQNRIANLTILVPAKTRLTMPVSCVEAGRWQARSRHFNSSRRAFYSSGRAIKARAVSESYRCLSRPVSDQSAIWDDIAAKSSRLGACSETSEMGVMYERSQAQLEDLEARFAAHPRQVGALFVAGGRLVGLEILDCPATWRKLLPKLSASYGLDAVDGAMFHGGPRRDGNGFDAGGFLARVKSLRCESYPAVGLGEDLRLSAPDLAGGALVVDGRVVHLGIFGEPTAA